MKIGSHSILLNTDFDTNSFDNYLNFQLKILIPGEAIIRGVMLKFSMETHIGIAIFHSYLKTFKEQYC